MRDLNFFEDYVEKRDLKVDRKLIYFTLASFVILAFITYTVFNYLIIRQETKTVESLRAIAENPKTLAKVEEIKEKEIEVNDFRDSVGKIRRLNEIIESKDIISETLLDKIVLKMPEDLFLTSIGIRSSDIQLVGMSKDKWSIADFEKGLETLDNVEDIFISNITLQEDYYNFNINITLEDVNIDGDEPEEEV